MVVANSPHRHDSSRQKLALYNICWEQPLQWCHLKLADSKRALAQLLAASLFHQLPRRCWQLQCEIWMATTIRKLAAARPPAVMLDLSQPDETKFVDAASCVPAAAIDVLSRSLYSNEDRKNCHVWLHTTDDKQTGQRLNVLAVPYKTAIESSLRFSKTASLTKTRFFHNTGCKTTRSRVQSNRLTL